MKFIQSAVELDERWKGLEFILRRPSILRNTGQARYGNGFSFLVLNRQGEILSDLPEGAVESAKSFYRGICSGRYSEFGKGEAIQNDDCYLFMPRKSGHAFAMKVYTRKGILEGGIREG